VEIVGSAPKPSTREVRGRPDLAWPLRGAGAFAGKIRRKEFVVIVCHSRNFIYIKTMKTGGTSLEIALSELCEDGDIITVLGSPGDAQLRREITGRTAQNYRYSFREWMRLGHKQKLLALFTDYDRSKFVEHMNAVRVRQAVGEEVWNSYFKFAVVRNPYDRFLSRYYYDLYSYAGNNRVNKSGDLIWGGKTPDEFLRYYADKVNENWRIYSSNDASLMDKIVRYEHFQEDLRNVSEAIGAGVDLFDRMKAIRTKSESRPKDKSGGTNVLSTREKLVIYLLCRREFDLYGYSPGQDVEEILAGRPVADIWMPQAAQA
jgi:Sulfotransferase family